MNGFKNFILRGNLVELAVAFIMASAFAAVVTAFIAWLTSKIPNADNLFAHTKLGDFGFFLNALISFLILAAVVYFLVVMPYTKVRDRYFPPAPPGTPEDIKILQEIRDLLAAQQGKPTSGLTDQ